MTLEEFLVACLLYADRHLGAHFNSTASASWLWNDL